MNSINIIIIIIIITIIIIIILIIIIPSDLIKRPPLNRCAQNLYSTATSIKRPRLLFLFQAYYLLLFTSVQWTANYLFFTSEIVIGKRYYEQQPSREPYTSPINRQFTEFHGYQDLGFFYCILYVFSIFNSLLTYSYTIPQVTSALNFNRVKLI